MRSLSFLCLLAVGCVTTSEPHLEQCLRELRDRVSHLEQPTAERPPLGGYEASEPIASLGTWVPVHAAKDYMLGALPSTSVAGIGGVTLDTTQTVTGAKTFSATAAFAGITATTATFSGNVLFSASLRTTAGQKLTFDGATEAKYLSSDGTTLTLTGLGVNAPTFTVSGATGNGYGLAAASANTHGMTFSGVSTLIRSNGAGSSVFLGNGSIWFAIFSGSGLQLNSQTLATCAAGIEGELSVDVLSGVATGKRTKLCVCTSDGSSAYKWQNAVTGTLGTTTTCGTE